MRSRASPRGQTNKPRARARARHLYPSRTAAASSRNTPLLAPSLTARALPDARSYSALISALGSGGEWRHALELLREMEAKEIAPHVRTYNSAIAACEHSRLWEHAAMALSLIHI